MINKKVALLTSALAVAGVGTLSASQVSAHFGGSDQMRERIAQRFNLNESDVQTFMDEMHDERKAEKGTQLTGRLDEAVAKGDITEVQKQLILEKQAEIEAYREEQHDAMDELSPEERRGQMEAHRAEIENWADENGIDMQYLFGRRIGRGGHGMRFGQVESY